MTNEDTIRLNFLSDYKTKFSYSLYEDGTVIVKEPGAAKCRNLRTATDYARAVLKQIPFCINCKNAVPSENRASGKEDGKYRWLCPFCKTSWLI